MATKTPSHVSAEIQRILSLNKNELRTLYREYFQRDAPEAFSKDLIARALTYRLQEKAFGGLDKAVERRLIAYAKPTDPKNPPRSLRSGTVLLREYQGTRHTVTILGDQYVYQDRTYASLSKIAREITGIAWNGPRFFGLRERKQQSDET